MAWGDSGTHELMRRKDPRFDLMIIEAELPQSQKISAVNGIDCSSLD